MFKRKSVDLQAKISLVLVGVIPPTYLLATIVQNEVARPLLQDEVRQMGVTSAKTVAAEIVAQRMLAGPNPTELIERHLQLFLYNQPSIVRMDVVMRDTATNAPKRVASSVEDEPDAPPIQLPLVEAVTSELKQTESGGDAWSIAVPIEHLRRDPKHPRRILGTVHATVSMRFMNQVLSTIWKVSLAASAVSVVVLILALRYFLRKTILNERLLRRAESENEALTQRLHEAQRQIMNNEKLAVMGQLTASFAHEIGTPLGAVGGHLQLLREELPSESPRLVDRYGIIQDQLRRIERIVKDFLQSTGQPESQRQLVDLNRAIDQTLALVRPRADALGVELKATPDRGLGPLRIVPIELEQILINLVNNSLDSLKSKGNGKLRLELSTMRRSSKGKHWAAVEVFDTGEGIRRTDLSQVMKPFFTTKRPGEGTGLGLSISQQLARKYGGVIEIESKEGSWTRVRLQIPYPDSL